jgi:uncharacterized protein YdeI (YjbR/CyaY-like superfamily)
MTIKANPQVDAFLKAGCGRCEKGGTPLCKVHGWHEVLVALRTILRDSTMTEELKWSFPCYTVDGRNVVMLSAFRDSCTLLFFQGELLNDPEGLLQKPGENSQSASRLHFTTTAEVRELETTIRDFISQAIALRKSGAKSTAVRSETPVPEELAARLAKSQPLKKAFNSLTPGRQRGYLLHFAAPKQSATRISRIEKCIPAIMAGKGLHDRD